MEAPWNKGVGARSPPRRCSAGRCRRASGGVSSRIDGSGEATCSGAGCRGGGDGRSAELLSFGPFFVMAWLLLAKPWGCWRSGGGNLVLAAGDFRRCFRRLLGSEFFPAQGMRSGGGGFGAGGSFLRRLRPELEGGEPWPRVVHRLKFRRSSAGNSCVLKAWRCSSAQVWGWPVFFFSAGGAGGVEGRRPARWISLLAVALILFRQSVPVCVGCSVFLLL